MLAQWEEDTQLKQPFAAPTVELWERQVDVSRSIFEWL